MTNENHLEFQLRAADDQVSPRMVASMRSVFAPEVPNEIVMVAYRIGRSRSYLDDQVRVSLDALRVQGVALKGPLRYLATEGLRPHLSPDVNDIQPGTRVELRAPKEIGPVFAPDDEYHLVLATPLDHELEGKPQETREAIRGPMERIAAAAGLVANVAGREFVEKRTFVNIIDLVTPRRIAHLYLTVPLYFRKGELDRDGLGKLKSSSDAISAMDAANAARVTRSLGWIERAAQSEGVDAFLQLWIAAETLVQETGEKALAAMCRVLAKAHGMSYVDVKLNVLQIGRIYGLRCKIAHDGLLTVDDRIIRYMEDVYADLLHASVDVDELRAQKSLAYWQPPL